MEGPFAHQVSADRIAPVEDLAIRALPAAISAGDTFEEVNLQDFSPGHGGVKILQSWVRSYILASDIILINCLDSYVSPYF